MIFSNIEYFVFFGLVLALYWSLKQKSRTMFLVIASYIFYGFWNPKYLLLMLFSTLVDFQAGLKMEQSSDAKHRKFWLLTSLLVNLGSLGIFKYFNFFVNSAVSTLAFFGIQADTPTLNVLLPVGISFYTFQSMSYTIDVYRKQIPVCHRFIDFACYVAFFPQLVAGPILRASEFIPQIKIKKKWDWDRHSQAVQLFILGYIKKAVIADRLAIGFVDPVFQNPALYDWATLVVAVLGYAIQIYYDFSGYTDMARGSAKLLGYDIPINFNFPYIADSFRDFWHRWHISLSTWLRDYLYIPLGGSRSERWLNYRNLFLTMALGGLWHGAAWTFVLWGVYHGALLAVERFGRDRGLQINLPKTFKIICVFVLVCHGWILFRCVNLEHYQRFMLGIFTLQNGLNILSVGLLPLFLFFVLETGIGALSITRKLKDVFSNLNWAWRGMIYAGSIVFAIAFSKVGQMPFIYFQF